MGIEEGEFKVEKGPMAGKTVKMSFQFPDDSPTTDEPGPNNRSVRQVVVVAYDILDNVVSPVLEIGGISADIFRADLWCYAGDDEDMAKILQAMSERYDIPVDDLDEFKGEPLAFLALYILSRASK